MPGKVPQLIEKPSFREHMLEKAKLWGPFQLILGKDFAVFEFDTVNARDIVRKVLLHYEKTYGYRSAVGHREQMVIINEEAE